MTNLQQLLKRKPREGDTIRSKQGRDYIVEKIFRTPGIRGVHFYAVVDAAERRYPNTLEPVEIAGVVSAPQA